MKFVNTAAAVGAGLLFVTSLKVQFVQDKPKNEEQAKTLTYAKDIVPIVKTYCLGCHGSDTDNPTELYTDDYESIMKGGKHGVPIVAGKPDESTLYTKLLPEPPFGRQMPRGRKKITPEAVQTIHDWIRQGAKKE